MLRIAAIVVGVLALLLVGRFAYLSMTSKPPEAVGSPSGLAPCADRPNCVSSLAESESQHIDPLAVPGDPEEALEVAVRALEAMPGSRIVTSGDGYLHAEFRTRIFRFVDDLELSYDSKVPGFQVRSASRVGHSDLGVNRKRVEALRALLSF